MADHGNGLALIVVLMLATVLLVGVGEKIKRPYPVLVTLLGLALALIPGLPQLRIDPELILPLFLPPLIYAAAQRTSWRMLQARRRTIFWLAGVLVLVTIAAVAQTALLIVPGITLAAAVALGAMVAPPDPVAAEAVAGPLKLPRRLVTVMQTEGLCNDATALVVYAVAVSAMTTGHGYSPGDAIGRFAWEVVAALGIGLLLGWLGTWLQSKMDSSTSRNALTLVFPFATYLIADTFHASGVLAVLVLGLYLGQTGEDTSGVTDRLTGTAFWDTLELLITGLAFGLIGLELREVLPGVNEMGDFLKDAAIICLVVIVLRGLWLLPANHLVRKRPGRDPVLENWREDLVLAFCGMRGLATLALALALPEDTPARPELLFIAFCVILVTLVVPGLTLPWVTRALGVQAEAEAEEEEMRDLAYRAARAALRRLRELDAAEDLPAEVVQKMRGRQRLLISELCDTTPEDMVEGYEQRRHHASVARHVEAEMLAASRSEILHARVEPGVDPEVADRVLRRLDLKSAHLL